MLFQIATNFVKQVGNRYRAAVDSARETDERTEELAMELNSEEKR